MQAQPSSKLLTCLECGFRIFNRRFAHCESCAADLPQAMLYSPSELASLREKERQEDQLRQTKLRSKSVEGSEGGISDFDLGSCGGDGGGGCD